MNYYFEDFTEDSYRQLLQLANLNWEFVDFPSFQSDSRICLWRHDIDFSVHRAHRLATIEAEEGVKATYFVDLHSNFYNALESEIIHLIQEIVGLGHFIGLHFDGTAYPDTIFNEESLAKALSTETKILEEFYGAPVSCFSFHNPDLWNALVFDRDKIGGLVNAYGKTIRQNFVYVSDSNGYWRYQRLSNVLKKTDIKRLHILTHDAWWQPTVMSPKERIRRCIKGRADKVWNKYEQLLRFSKREFVE